MSMRLQMILTGVLAIAALASLAASAQTTSPRNLQAPTTEELMAACARMKADDRQDCEKRVRSGGAPSEATLNKSAVRQQSERQATQNRSVTDPGAATVPSRASDDSNPSARTRDGNTRMSQRSEDIRTAPRPPAEPNSSLSTEAAATRVNTPQERKADKTRIATDGTQSKREKKDQDHRDGESKTGTPDTIPNSHDRAPSKPPG